MTTGETHRADVDDPGGCAVLFPLAMRRLPLVALCLSACVARDGFDERGRLTGDSGGDQAAGDATDASDASDASDARNAGDTGDAGADPPGGDSLPALAPVGWWSFSETMGVQAVDHGTGGHAGLLVGATSREPGAIGPGLRLDGSTGYVSVGDHPEHALTQGVTLTAWVFNDGTNSGANPTFVGRDRNYELRTNQTGEHLDLMLHDPDADQTNVYGNVVLTVMLLDLTDTWHHVAGTYDAATRTLRAYLDGVLIGELTSSGGDGAMTARPGELEIGRRIADDPDSLFGGLIDEVRVYDRALNEEEILRDRAGAP